MCGVCGGGWVRGFFLLTVILIPNKGGRISGPSSVGSKWVELSCC